MKEEENKHTKQKKKKKKKKKRANIFYPPPLKFYNTEPQKCLGVTLPQVQSGVHDHMFPLMYLPYPNQPISSLHVITFLFFFSSQLI